MKIPHSPYLPFNDSVALYNTAMGHLTPFEFEGWRTEEQSWKTTAYLHGGLNPADPFRLSGPDALKLLQDSCVNDFSTFRFDGSKHAIMCAPSGKVIADGVVIRTGEDSFDCFYLNPVLQFLVATGDYDVTLADLTDELFLFQLGGPASFQILEAATGVDLRPLRFMRHRPATIETSSGPVEVRVYRFGVAGTLAYEIHGPIEHAPAAYEALLAAGEEFGVVQLGLRAYGMNHTQNGFAQAFIHFLPAWPEQPGLMDFLEGRYDKALADLPGSAGPDLAKRFGTPFELGWGDLVTFNHDFTGRAALEQISNSRLPVTLVWNPEDVVDVFASQFRPEPFDYMDLPADPIWTTHSSIVFADDVLVGDELVGISSGRIFSASAHSMLSLAIVDPHLTTPGTSVDVVWGAPHSTQRRIRATVAPFPFLAMPRNPDYL